LELAPNEQNSQYGLRVLKIPFRVFSSTWGQLTKRIELYAKKIEIRKRVVAMRLQPQILFQTEPQLRLIRSPKLPQNLPWTKA